MSTTVLLDDRLREFSRRFRGDLRFVLVPHRTRSARTVWNGMVDRRPACIAPVQER